MVLFLKPFITIEGRILYMYEMLWTVEIEKHQGQYVFDLFTAVKRSFDSVSNFTVDK